MQLTPGADVSSAIRKMNIRLNKSSHVGSGIPSPIFKFGRRTYDWHVKRLFVLCFICNHLNTIFYSYDRNDLQKTWYTLLLWLYLNYTRELLWSHFFRRPCACQSIRQSIYEYFYHTMSYNSKTNHSYEVKIIIYTIL